jgi:bifunctional DNA-binding transcriptional regulator/antitoxin component of YhaV-PrlF toxin-antitoxin module
MPFLMIDDQLRVVIPTGLRRDLGLMAGDVLGATLGGSALRLLPRITPDRARVVAELDALSAAHPASSEDEGKTDDEIIEDIAARWAEQRAQGK